MIPPLDRCQPRQELNLQLPSFDGRVFRRNRTLTASEIEWRRIIAHRDALTGVEPVSSCDAVPLNTSAGVSACSLPPNKSLGENQTRKRPEPASTIARRPRLPWSPSQAQFSPRPGARFRIPYCRRERGLMVAEVALSSLPRKWSREKTDQGMLTCSTIELPSHWGEGSDSNRQPRAYEAK